MARQSAGLVRAAVFQARKANYFRRKQWARLDDPDVRQFRRFVRATSHGPAIDVLYLGDSTVSLISPSDTDRRGVDQMISDALGADVRLYGLHGAGYMAGMFTEYLRPLRTSSSRPVVLVSLCSRLGTLPWYVHPFFARRGPIEFMAGVDLHRRRPIRASFPKPSGAVYAEHMARRFPTWMGDLSIGEYVGPLKAHVASQYANPTEELTRLLYAYHHGGELLPGYLDDLEALGRLLRDLGVPVVAYETPVPVQRGVEYFGEGFGELAERNFTAMAAALRRGIGEEIPVLKTGAVCGTDEFLDPDDGSEHLNQVGRARIAAMIVDGLQAVRGVKPVTSLP